MYASVIPAVMAAIAGPGPLLQGCDGIAMMLQERFSNRDRASRVVDRGA